MSKIEIFKEDNKIGDRVIIYRNFGNEDIEGTVAEIGDSYVVLLKDNGSKSRVFEDIISGWDTIAQAIPEEQNETSAEQELSIVLDSEINNSIPSDSILTEQNQDNDVAIESQVASNDATCPIVSDIIPDTRVVEEEGSTPKIGVTVIGKIDLSTCGDPRFRNSKKTSPASDIVEAPHIVDTVEVSPIVDTVEVSPVVETVDNDTTSTTDLVIDSLSETKEFLLSQYAQVNSTFTVDVDSVTNILSDLRSDYLSDDKVILENAIVVGVANTYCTIERSNGVSLKCYYSRIADYELIDELKNFTHGDRIPIIACTHNQKHLGKELVTAVCKPRSPRDYIDQIIGYIDEENFVYAKLLFDIIRGNKLLKTKYSTTRQSWQDLANELKVVSFTQLDLPLISNDLKPSSDSFEKNIFKRTELLVKKHIDLGEITDAIEAIDRAIADGSLTSKYVSNLLLRKAQIYSSVDDIENALLAYSEVIKYNESKGASKNNLSHLYTELARLLLLSPENLSQAIKELNKAIQLNPANKLAADLKAQTIAKSKVNNDKSSIEIKLEGASQSFACSKMIDIDIQEHKFTDSEILERNNVASTEIAKRLYNEAIISTEPEQYPKYLEAAKAFSGLKVGSYNLQDYLYVIANYSRLKGNYLLNSVKRILSGQFDSIAVVSNITRLKDSAQSYYLETLDIWSLISGSSFDIENTSDEIETSNDEILGVVLEILANYLKLDVTHYYLSNNIVCDYKSIFNNSFSQIFNQCIKSRNAELEKIAYHTVIQIGSYSTQVWNKLSQMKDGTRSLYAKFTNAESRSHIFDLINSIQGANIDVSLSPGNFLKKSFTMHAESRNKFEAESASLQSEVLSPHNIAEITEKWQSLATYWSVLSKTESEIKDRITEILQILKPYLSRKDSERTNLLIKAQNIIDSLIIFINENTTYYGRTFFFPLLTNWKKELKNILDERIALSFPVLDVKGDPMYILHDNGRRVLNLVISNTGDSSADGFELSLSFNVDGMNEVITVSSKETEIAAGDKTHIKLDLTDYTFIAHPVIAIKASISPYYLSNLLPAYEYEFSVESEKDEFTLTDADILWSDTRTPEQQMFVGREEILDRLIRHYSSIERHEPYILYGLTRTGKSSILQYLGENINGKTFRARDQKEYNIIPIFIDFSQGASLNKASDFWNYVINECVFPQLDELAISYHLFKCNGDSPRAKDFGLLLTDLKGIGLYPLFLIDEFSYIRTLIDKDIVNAAFLHSLRQYSLDGKASFIYAGTYDIKSLIKDAKYGFTGALVTAHDEEIGKIDYDSAEELMDAMRDEIVITDDAKTRIHELSGDIPYFIQIICKNLGFFAVEYKRKFIGYPELEKIVNILTGKDTGTKMNMVKVLPENRFQNNQYSPLDPIEVSVLISSIVEKNRGLKIPRGVSYAELQDMWGSHGISDFRPKLAKAIELLVEKKVLMEFQDDGMPVYKLSVDIFRLWWENHHKDINRELSTIM